MIKFLLWCILLVLCWPLALAALLLYPIVWLLLLPFRIVGIAVEGSAGPGMGGGNAAVANGARGVLTARSRADR